MALLSIELRGGVRYGCDTNVKAAILTGVRKLSATNRALAFS